MRVPRDHECKHGLSMTEEGAKQASQSLLEVLALGCDIIRGQNFSGVKDDFLEVGVGTH